MFSRFIARVRRRTIGVCDQTEPFLMALTDLQEFFFNTPFQGSRLSRHSAIFGTVPFREFLTMLANQYSGTKIVPVDSLGAPRESTNFDCYEDEYNSYSPQAQ